MPSYASSQVSWWTTVQLMNPRSPNHLKRLDVKRERERSTSCLEGSGIFGVVFWVGPQLFKGWYRQKNKIFITNRPMKVYRKSGIKLFVVNGWGIFFISCLCVTIQLQSFFLTHFPSVFRFSPIIMEANSALNHDCMRKGTSGGSPYVALANQAACGADHSLILTTGGSLWSAGRGRPTHKRSKKQLCTWDGWFWDLGHPPMIAFQVLCLYNKLTNLTL